MKSLLPPDDTELSKEARLYMSHGMKNVLIHHGFNDVTPEMVRSPDLPYSDIKCFLVYCSIIYLMLFNNLCTLSTLTAAEQCF
jgi:hypothetical protein